MGNMGGFLLYHPLRDWGRRIGKKKSSSSSSSSSGLNVESLLFGGAKRGVVLLRAVSFVAEWVGWYV